MTMPPWPLLAEPKRKPANSSDDPHGEVCKLRWRPERHVCMLLVGEAAPLQQKKGYSWAERDDPEHPDGHCQAGRPRNSLSGKCNTACERVEQPGRQQCKDEP